MENIDMQAAKQGVTALGHARVALGNLGLFQLPPVAVMQGPSQGHCCMSKQHIHVACTA